MRTLLSTFLVNEAIQNPNFYVFSGDHGYALFDPLRQERPSQFINAGVSEQAMVGYAAGFARSGLKCVVYGLAAFVPLRVLEFIKIDVCHDNLPIIFIGDGAGLVYNTLGMTHQCAEDIAALRCLPNMAIYSPADEQELKICLTDASKRPGPSYIRIGKSDRPTVHKCEISFPLNGGLLPVLEARSSVAIVATGSMVSSAMSIASRFEVSVFSAPFLSNLSPSIVGQQLRAYNQIISIEEHSINGGLGSILAEILTHREIGGKSLLRLGIRNKFTEKCGSYEYALREHGIDTESLLVDIQKGGIDLSQADTLLSSRWS